MIGNFDGIGIDMVINSSSISISNVEQGVYASVAFVTVEQCTFTHHASITSTGKIELGEAFCSCLITDRSDGLFTTVVVDEQGVALGVAYSSVKSVTEALRTRQGVYHSRSRGLWHKGLTSGATQSLLRIDVDCDKDCLRFMVHQQDPGFCHLNTRTCFGADSGITALDALLRSRLASAPAGSYTQQLFKDTNLLRSKIMEEAEELCDAETPQDVASEAADLIYFALVRCASVGVSLTDIEAHLDKRARKISRRPGNAKPKWDVVNASRNRTSPENSTAAPQEAQATTSTNS
ncbi:hypothetical protein HDU93_006196 [Gonapodya sp. JEL0774]|nr:hypothetical protein HDU93_006196 [Gonapodya sp. JEL0774]